jgi:hypothetical protein
MRFVIYDAATAGTQLWNSGAFWVQVTGGVFSVLLGDTGQPNLTLDFDEDYWLEVRIDGDIQSPRVQLGSVGYAYMASGVGVYASATATTGETYGLWAVQVSYGGSAVRGQATGSSGSGDGVSGQCTATTGYTYGVYGSSSSINGTGVYGTASAGEGTTYGVYGSSSSTDGYGVQGEATATTGTVYGVRGVTYSIDGAAVWGDCQAFSGSTYGVWGMSASINGTGVYGHAHAASGLTYGVYGKANSTDGYGVYYDGGLGGIGLMRNIVETSRGPTGLDVHTTAGNWVEDFGEGRLDGGGAHIELDPVFLETITIDEDNPMKVFVQLKDDCQGTYVRPGITGFDVFELRNGASNARFSYRVVAAKKGLENRRLEVETAGR